MFPSARTRNPQPDTISPQNESNTSSSRASGFSRFLKRASPGSAVPALHRVVGRDVSDPPHEDGGKPVRRQAFENERSGMHMEKEEGRGSWNVAGRSEVSISHYLFVARRNVA